MEEFIESIIEICLSFIILLILLVIIIHIFKYIINLIEFVEYFNNGLIFLYKILGCIPLESNQKFVIILSIILIYPLTLIIKNPSLIVLIAYACVIFLIFSICILLFYYKQRNDLEEANLSSIRNVGDLYENEK